MRAALRQAHLGRSGLDAADRQFDFLQLLTSAYGDADWLRSQHVEISTADVQSKVLSFWSNDRVADFAAFNAEPFYLLSDNTYMAGKRQVLSSAQIGKRVSNQLLLHELIFSNSANRSYPNWRST